MSVNIAKIKAILYLQLICQIIGRKRSSTHAVFITHSFCIAKTKVTNAYSKHMRIKMQEVVDMEFLICQVSTTF